MKRIISCILAIALLLAVVPTMPISASAETSGYFTYTVTDGKAAITDCNTAISGSVTIPSTLGGYPVTKIGDNAFFNCSNMTSLTIPDSVTYIGGDAFAYCRNLTSVNIPNGVTAISYSTFFECDNLSSITIPSSVTSIGNSAFYGSGLTSITIPDSVTSIGESVFYYCYDLTSVSIGDGVTTIGNSAFCYCSSLTLVELGASVVTIGTGAFSACFELAGIWVDEKNPNYSSDAKGVLFNKDKTTLIQSPNALTGSYEIPSGVTAINKYAFNDRDDMTSVSVPASVTTIGTGAFEHCNALTGIWVDAENPNYSSDNSGVLFDKSQSKLLQAPGALAGSYEIPDQVSSIAEMAFAACFELTAVTIPNSITTIASNTFNGCTGLSSVKIPISVISIASQAFYNCPKLTDIYYGGTQEQWDAISIGSYNTPLDNAIIHLNCVEPTGISIKTLPAKLKYIVGETLDTTGLVLTVSYDNGSTKDVTMGYETSCYSSETAGTKTVTVSYEDYTATFTVEVSAHGTCGTDLTWTLDPKGTLTISGTGAMYNYSNHSAPWYSAGVTVRRIILEEGVTSVGNYAFGATYGSVYLTVIPSTLESIGREAFMCGSRCVVLNSETIASKATTYDSVGYLLYYTQSVLVKEGISYGNYVRNGRTNTSAGEFDGAEYTIFSGDSAHSFKQNNVSEMELLECENCSAVKDFSETEFVVTMVGDGSATGKIYKEDDNVVLKLSGVGSIFESGGDYPWSEYRYLVTRVVIDEGITSIPRYAFNYFTSMTSITIPDSVTNVGGNAFYNCTSLKYNIHDNGKYLGNSKNPYVVLIEAVSDGIATCDIYKDAKVIYRNAFYNCGSLTTVSIPNSVTSIGDYAFDSCFKLTDVYYGGTQLQWDAISIGTGNTSLSNATLHVKILVAQMVGADGTVGTSYESLEAAIVDFTGGYIQLIDDITDTVQITKDVYVDLNGFDVTVSIDEGANFYGMDSKTDDYSVEGDDLGVLTITEGELITSSSITRSGETHRYLALPSEDGTYTFHRFCLNTRKGLRTYSAAGRTGIYFQPEFKSNEVVIAAIDNGDDDIWNIGVKVQLLDGNEDKIEFAPINGTDSAGAAALANGAIYRVAIYDLMPTNVEIAKRASKNSTKYPDCSTWTAAAYLETFDLSAYEVEGTAYIMINGTAILDESGADRISLQNAIKQVDQMYDTLSDTQKQAVSNMWATYSRAISSWFAAVDGGLDDFLINIGNIKIDISDWFD